MWKKRGLFLILFVIILNTVIYAQTDNVSGGFFSKYLSFENASINSPFFLFCTTEFNNCKGKMLVFFGNVKINGNFDGDIKLFFSNVIINDGNKIECNIETFSSQVYYPDNSNVSIKPLFNLLNFGKTKQLSDGIKIYSDEISIIVFKVLLSCFIIIASFIILPVKKSFFEQCAGAVMFEPIQVLKSGLIFYFILVSLAVVFALSIIGFPITIIMLLLIIIFSVVGEVSLSIVCGHYICDKLSIKTNSYYSLLAGVIFIELLKFTPYLDWLLCYMFIPIFALGAFSAGLINGFIKKSFYELPYSVYNV